MNGLIVFTKKELTEQLRSYKALIITAVLFLFGMSSPLLAKIMPDIFSNMSVSGIILKMPKPTDIDAWSQFFKNVSEMGLIVLMLVFGGVLSQELSKGTLVIPLSKGLSRGAVVGSKFIAAVITWTVGYCISALTCCGYTQYLFGRYNEPRLIFSLFCMWLFGVFLLSVLLLAGSTAPGTYGGLLVTAIVLGIMLIVNVIPKVQKWNPVTLASENADLLTNAKKADDLACAVWVTLILTILCLVLSLVAFKKKKL